MDRLDVFENLIKQGFCDHILAGCMSISFEIRPALKLAAVLDHNVYHDNVTHERSF